MPTATPQTNVLHERLNVFNSPPGLEALRQWICYRLEQKGDKLDKIPTDPHTGNNISKMDPSNWMSCGDALDARDASEHVQGVGVVITEDDPYACLDIDHCRNPATAEIEAWARDIVNDFYSYTEVTPSGTGLRVWLYGQVTGTTRPTVDGHRIEAYSQNKFLTVTGDHLDGTPKKIYDRADKLTGLGGTLTPTALVGESNGLSDDGAISTMLGFKNGEKYRKLLEGDVSEYGGPSEADYALASGLAFVCGNDMDQIERIMRGSKLRRDKWDKHGTYLRELTISKAIAMHEGKFYTPPMRLTVGEDIDGWLDLQGLFDGGIEPESHHVPGLLQRGRVHNLHSKPGEGKTILALYLAKQVKDLGELVYYMDAENGPKPMVQRLAAMGVTDFRKIRYNSAPDLTTPGQIEVFLKGVDRRKPTLVVFDSLADMLAMSGLDENDAGDVTKWFADVVKPLRDRAITVLILDHEPWESRGHARGSTAKFAKVDVELEMKRTKHFDAHTLGEVTLKVKKDRFSGFEQKVRKLAVGGQNGRLMVQPSDSTHFEGTLVADSLANTLKAIESFGERGARDSEWQTATKEFGTGRTQYYDAKRELLENGRVTKHADGSFTSNVPVRVPNRTSQVRVPSRTSPDLGDEEARIRLGNELSTSPGGEPDLTEPQHGGESGLSRVYKARTTGPHAGLEREMEIARRAFDNSPDDTKATIKSQYEIARNKFGPTWQVKDHIDYVRVLIRDGYMKGAA